MQIRRGIFFQSSSRNQNITSASSPLGYSWRSIDEQTIVHDPIFTAKDRRAKACARREAGHACYGFFDSKGGVAYYMWVTIARDAKRAASWELNTQLVLKPKTGYFWDCFTAPEHRRRGLYSGALRNAMALAIKQGAEKGYICCLKENMPSINAIRSSGFHDVFEFTVGRIGPLVFCKRSDRSASLQFGIPKFAIIPD